MKHEGEIRLRRHKMSRHISITLSILTIVVALIMATFLILYVSYKTNVDGYRSSILIGNGGAVTNSVVKGFELPDGTSNIPKTLYGNSIIGVVAKNQPAVVRVLTIQCADIELKLNKDYISKNTCTAAVGSGSIISSDGYISTNGHVVSLSNNSLISQSITSISQYTEILQYLVSDGIITLSEGNSLLNDLSDSSNSQEASIRVVKLIPKNKIVITNLEKSYSVQLSNEPIRIDAEKNHVHVSLGGSIKAAKFIDEDFNIESSEDFLASGGGFSSSDVALLKIEGNYPYIRLGSIDEVKRGDILTAIGFPAFVDNSVDTSRWQTVPSVTQGIVKSIINDSSSSNRKLITSNVQVAQGSSGGPALDENGLQVGLNTYANIECANLMCFGDATIRDIADIKLLLVKNNIVLKTDSDINDHWYSALGNYEQGNLTSALNDFEWTEVNYPFNYLASSLSKNTRSQLGSSSDISTNYKAQSNIYQLAIIIISTFLGLVVVSISLTRYLNIRHRRTLIEPKTKNVGE